MRSPFEVQKLHCRNLETKLYNAVHISTACLHFFRFENVITLETVILRILFLEILDLKTAQLIFAPC